MKIDRHSKILEILGKYEVETQEDLTNYLRESGINVTQATVSRDIREMKLVKVMTKNGKYKYASYDNSGSNLDDRIVNVFREAVLTVDYAGNFVCLHTITGMAMAAGVAIDSLKLTEIIGTVAGDDTIFILVRDEEKAIDLAKKFKNLLKKGK